MAAKPSTVDPIAIEQGQRIAQLRKENKWRQQDLAQATGWTDDKPDSAQPNALSPSRIANYEQGTRRVPIEAAKILERVSGLPTAYFLGVISYHEAEIIKTLRRRPSA